MSLRLACNTSARQATWQKASKTTAAPLRSRMLLQVRAQVQQQPEAKDTTSLSMEGMMTMMALVPQLTMAGAAQAENAVITAVESGVADAAAPATQAPNPAEFLVILAPIVVYGLFNVFRQYVNPKANFLDYIFLLAFAAIVGNIISIAFFKVRYF